VGSFPAGVNGYGLHDMAGNVWELCWDWRDITYYSTSLGSDPRGPASGSGRVDRGGGWGLNAVYCRVAYRGNSDPGGESYNIGFRSALPPGQ
jgi:sulfatase modifying factor 1